MDHPAAASWGPCEFQLPNWTAEEPAAADVWAPAGLPVPVEHYWPIDIFDSCSIQACVPGSRGAEQLVERCYYYSAASEHQHDGPSENPVEAIIDVQDRHEVKENSGNQSGETTKVIVTNDSGIDVGGVFEHVSRKFKGDIDMTKKKVHRYPAVLGDLDENYTVPKIVSIGPYHHGKPRLKKTEEVKHMAAIQCVKESGLSLEVVYEAVVSVAVEEAHSLYDKDVMEGIERGDDFWHMMFFDACFLVQYILIRYTNSSKVGKDQSLCKFFSLNRKDIFQDITMFENQLPWKVLQTVLEFLPVPQDPNPILEFINRHRDYLRDQLTEDGKVPRLEFDKDYKAPHLLGLLRHHTVGKISDGDVNTTNKDNIRTPSISISARELAEIGITLKGNLNSTDLVRMGLRQEGALGVELSLVPVTLDHNRASYLVNMAALELRTVTNFLSSPFQDSAVCSYLQLLAMLVHREEDVQELRAKGVLQGGGGLTDQQVLSFFSSFQGQRRGKLYFCIMRDIEVYKEREWFWIKIYSFLYKKWTVLSATASVIVTLLSLK